jgi:two-component system chemotaxis sensor kinase CheA
MPASPELKQQIENLALNLVMANPDSDAMDWLPAIREIKQRALAEQAQAVADAAASGEAGTVVPKEIIARLQRAAEAVGTAAPSFSLAQDPELLRDFVIESRENLLAIETQILKLERTPDDTEALNAAFRSFHTIKASRVSWNWASCKSLRTKWNLFWIVPAMGDWRLLPRRSM